MTAAATAPSLRRLRIFVPHASDRFTDHLPHGDGLVAFEVARRLALRGHDVHVMSPAIEVAGAIPASLHLERLGKPQTHGPSSRLAYLAQVRSTFARLHRAAPFDVAHQLNPVATGVSLALAGVRVPIVLGAFVGAWPRGADSANILGATDFPFAETLRRQIARLQQRLAAALIVSTPSAESLIVDVDREREKIFEIPHGIDPAAFEYGNMPPEREGPTILFLGGTERRKGIYVLLEAFAAVYRAMPSARLVIAGAGGREGQVAEAVARMPEREGIAMLGAVPRSAVPGLMREATVFAAPSFGEPFGMALLEAMASAKAVVVTDAGGPAHIVDAEGGWKVPVGDADALAAALLEALRSPARAARMGRHNRAKIETIYAWDRVVDRIEAVYAHVLSRKRAA
jgi:glycosyltransferase involved in cell wall biosynthesis